MHWEKLTVIFLLNIFISFVFKVNSSYSSTMYILYIFLNRKEKMRERREKNSYVFYKID